MDVCRTATMATKDQFMLDRRMGKWTKQKSYCSCTTLTRQRAVTYSIGRVEFFKTSVESSKHSVACPFYISTEATTTIGFKMAYYGRLLANTVRATLSITSGAGGYSINPCLKFHARVPCDSPAFLILDPETFRIRRRTTPPSQIREVCGYFENALQQLYELFRDGRASPTDTDEHGWTLVHVI